MCWCDLGYNLRKEDDQTSKLSETAKAIYQYAID